MLSDIATLKGFIGVPLSDTSQDDKLNLCLTAADSGVKRFCKRDLERSLYTEFPFRFGGEAIVTLQTPILCYRLQGNIQAGQPTITNLPSTSSLLPGMTAILASSVNQQTTQPFPNAATILTVDSSSQVTMSGNASTSVTGATLIFGLSVWFDPNGSFGDGQGTDPSGPFGPTTILYPGIDYALQRDQPDGTSKSGKIIKLSGVFGILGMGGAWNSFGGTWNGLNGRGTLSANLKPLWPNWPPGSVRIMYAAGLPTIPADLTAATNGLAAWLWQNSIGGLLQTSSEGFNGESVSIGALQKDPMLGSVRQLLSRYRNVAI